MSDNETSGFAFTVYRRLKKQKHWGGKEQSTQRGKKMWFHLYLHLHSSVLQWHLVLYTMYFILPGRSSFRQRGSLQWRECPDLFSCTYISVQVYSNRWQVRYRWYWNQRQDISACSLLVKAAISVCAITNLPLFGFSTSTSLLHDATWHLELNHANPQFIQVLRKFHWRWWSN